MIKAKIESLIRQELQGSFPIEGKMLLEIPKNQEYGDFATNISFQLAKKMRMSPLLIARNICDKLSDSMQGDFFKFNAVNGFINIKVSCRWLWQNLLELYNDKINFPETDNKILIEYVSANPTGPLHIGHGRWAVIGSTIDSILRFTKRNTYSEFYINDAGNQIKNFYNSVAAVRNNKPVPENGYHGSYIKDLAKSKEDPLKINIQHQKNTLNKIQVHFQNWYSEKSLYENSMVSKTIALLKEKKLTYENEGALWFKSQNSGDEKDRVLIKADGTYTYFAVDIAYHYDKIQRGYNKLINIWGADHHGYIQRVKAAVSALCGPQFMDSSSFTIIIGQLVSLLRGSEPVRMSKRTGEIITLDEVIEEIGPDATRYFLLQKSPDTHIEFDLELAKQKSSENPVFYIQYAHARICNILKKMGDINLNLTLTWDNHSQLNSYERQLVFKCIMVYDEIWAASNLLAPHKLANYTWDLARHFHVFYENCHILKADEETAKKRIVILNQTKKTLVLCLELMGISAPETM
ncbi:MAG: arginine--tRNA ligase [bacterium]|nr:arginine--tRNA ligase [bacterium]